jgi:hypothetical protein
MQNILPLNSDSCCDQPLRWEVVVEGGSENYGAEGTISNNTLNYNGENNTSMGLSNNYNFNTSYWYPEEMVLRVFCPSSGYSTTVASNNQNNIMGNPISVGFPSP